MKADFGMFNGEIAIKAEADSGESLDYLVMRYRNGKIKPAPHQRDPEVWTKKQRTKWIKRLANAMHGIEQNPLGVACLYMLKEHDRQEYINDGLQRIAAAAHALAFPDMYEHTLEQIQTVLERTRLYVQHRVYETHTQAAADFVAVNDGVSLDPSEKHKHVLVYAGNWDMWSGQIDLWNERLKTALQSFSLGSERRISKLAGRRQNLVLFAVAHNKKSVKIGTGPEVEKAVEACFAKSNPEIVGKNIKRAEAFVAEINHAWRGYIKNPHEMMQENLAKWCLGVMFMHEGVASPQWWQEFFTKLFSKTGGGANLSYLDEKGRTKSIYLAKRLDNFQRTCRALEIDIPFREDRPRSERLLRPGWQNDHVAPFADYGDGPTTPLPARLNAAKNARIVKSDGD